MADAFIIGFVGITIRIGHRRFASDELGVIIIFQSLLFDEVSQNLHISMALGIGGKNVVVGNDDDLIPAPHLGLASELLVEDTDRAGTADIVGHQYVDIDPDVFA